ncbi:MULTISPECIES: hypothetical protein [unclassified Variovorax]|jgi:hypothetical protein|uniref:hypothetical protein n=1 Tax=unclassified Variovorax TaxID=663243 RepID=UPI000F7E1346|nr:MULTISPECIES: hypothetical protein [unclassified Variovorax]RSZ38206.1 hypothetical protein EJO70_18880 [Variovorax sp. 553]RSZ39343.1 hypothetical protein EJO71_20370 [Variovorax sp. 679]
MKSLLLALTVSLGMGSAFAQPDSGIRVSTDPARAAAVLNHAQQLQAQPADKTAMMAPSTSAKVNKHKARHHHAKRHARKS